MFADMHCHTVLSDGTVTPEDVVRLAAAEGVQVLALTDHDTTDGVARAWAVGEEVGVRVVPGVEVSTMDGDSSVHVLGLFVDPGAPWVAALTKRQLTARRRRIEVVCEKLATVDVPVDFERVMELAGEGTVGRPHVARAMIEAGWALSVDDAFQRWLGNGQPGYVPTTGVSVDEAIEGIRDSGGVAVLAHPAVYGLDDRIPAWVDAGLGGIECAHPRHKPSLERRYRQVCQDLSVAVSGGSDFHGGGAGRSVAPGAVGLTERELEALEQRATRG